MIESLSSTPVLSKRAAAFERMSPLPESAEPEETFESSQATGAELMAQPGFNQPMHKHRFWTSKDGVAAALLTAGTVAAAVLPTGAQAAEVRPAPVRTQDPGLRLLLQSRAARGQAAHVDVETAYRTMPPEVVSELRTLPANLQEQYLQLEQPARRYMHQQLSAKTSIVAGLIKVSNRNAFIRGNVMGVDVFGVVSRDMHNKIRHGQIPAEMQTPIDTMLNTLRGLSRPQRETLVRALEAEFHH